MNKIVMLMMVVLITGCGPSHMVAKEPCIDIRGVKPVEGKAALVVGRTTIFGGGINFENYLNKTFIGTTKGRSFFITSVDPGDHYITAHGENYASMLIRFEAGKTYYVQNEVRMGAFMARAKVELVDAQHMHNDMGGDCFYYEKDPTEEVEGLTDVEFGWARENWGKTTPINAQPSETITK